MTGRLATLLSLGEPSLEAMLGAVAEELGAGTEVADAHARIGLLVERLDEDLRDPALQLDQLGDRVGGAFDVVAREDRPVGDDSLLRPDHVLRTGFGDELVIAAIMAAVGQRRGWSVDVVLGGTHAVVAHRALDAHLVVSPRYQSHIVDASDLHDPALAWCGPHEVASALLERLGAAGVSSGPSRASARGPARFRRRPT
jgi:hypothetical protein